MAISKVVIWKTDPADEMPHNTYLFQDLHCLLTYNNRQGQKHIFILKVLPVTSILVYHIQSNEIQENID